MCYTGGVGVSPVTLPGSVSGKPSVLHTDASSSILLSGTIMEASEEYILGNSITELVTFTWDIVVRMKDQCASDIDVQKAHTMARELRILVEYYEEYGSGLLSATTIWMAQEVANAVDDISLQYHS